MLEHRTQEDSPSEQYDGDGTSKIHADVVNESTTSYLVEYPDGSVTSEPKTIINSILFTADPGEIDPDDLSIVATGSVEDSSDEWDDTITLRADIESHDFTLQCGAHRIKAPEPTMNTVANALTRAVEQTNDVGGTIDLDYRGVQQVRNAFVETIEQRVRREVVDHFVDAFGDAVQPVSEGWILGSESEGTRYILTDDLVNLPLNRRETGPEFIRFNSEIDGAIDVETDYFAGRLTESEQEFLGTVLSFVESEAYLGVSLLDAEADAVPDVIETAASDLTVNRFWDDTSGRLHAHDLDKHTVSDAVPLTDEARDELVYNEFDHAGLHEIHYRRSEFESMDIDVFSDGNAKDHFRRVDSKRGSAKISSETRQDLQSIAGN